MQAFAPAPAPVPAGAPLPQSALMSNGAPSGQEAPTLSAYSVYAPPSFCLSLHLTIVHRSTPWTLSRRH